MVAIGRLGWGGILALALLGVGSCGRPTAPTPTGAGPGSLVVYTAQGHQELALATTTDSRQVIYLGQKGPTGLPTALSEVVVDAQDSSRRIFISYDSAGRPVTLASNDSGQAQITWGAAGPLSITLVSADGQSRYTKVLAQQAASVANLATLGLRRSGKALASDNTPAVCSAISAALAVVCQVPVETLEALLPVACKEAAAVSGPLAPTTFVVCALGAKALELACAAFENGGEFSGDAVTEVCSAFLDEDPPPPTPPTPPPPPQLLPAVTSLTYAGTSQTIEPKSVQSSNCTPSPFVNQVVTNSSAQLAVGAPLESPGSFSGTLTFGTTTTTLTTPTLTCANGGATSTIPGTTTTTQVGPGGTESISGTSDGHVISLSQATQTLFCTASAITCTVNGTVSVTGASVAVTVIIKSVYTDTTGSLQAWTMTLTLIEQ
jgi:hypothetical protein